MYYYRVNGHLCCSLEEGLPYEAVSCPESAKELIWLFAREPGEGRASFKVNDAALMHQEKEDVSWLNKNLLGDVREDSLVQKLIGEGKVRAVNRLHPRFEEILEEKPDKKKKRVHLLAIGDVGSNLLTGLHLLGGDVIGFFIKAPNSFLTTSISRLADKRQVKILLNPNFAAISIYAKSFS